MKSAVKIRLLLLAPLMLAAPALARESEPAAPLSGPEADYPVTVGDPYVIGGSTYTPSDTLNYDAVGYAHAGTTGSGISGAHHTLPLPCYVEVTALDTGHTILLRLERRGPMDGKQLIELSPGAWAQLGFTGTSDVAVRVRRVNPPETERARLRTGGRASDRMDTPPGLLTALRRKLGVATPAAPDEPPSALLAGPSQKPIATGLPPAPAPQPKMPPAPQPKMPPAPQPKIAPPSTPLRPVPTQSITPPPVASKPEPKIAPPSTPLRPVATPPVVSKPAPKIAPPSTPLRPVTPAPVVAKPDPKPAPATHTWIQVAAFAQRANAEKAAAQVGGKVEPAGKLWRVRIPAASQEQARAALAKAKQAGYAGAIVVHHD